MKHLRSEKIEKENRIASCRWIFGPGGTRKVYARAYTERSPHLSYVVAVVVDVCSDRSPRGSYKTLVPDYACRRRRVASK
jgi:hypothetical protein